MPKAILVNMAGTQVGEVELSEAVFGIEPNQTVVHEVVKNHLANCRQGTQSALTRAALITRGIAELARLGVAMGCNVHTFAGLAGIGDLIVTATSMHSRNNRAGILIGKGETPEQAVKEVGMVVEGMNALPAALELAAKYQVEMPIVQTVNAVVNKGMSAAEAVRSLMDRDPKNELPQDYEK